MENTKGLGKEPTLPTEEQRKAPCDLIHQAFVELRYLSEEQAART
jgi:hypothetical protein